MSKAYVFELDCIRGLAMLGVVGIHTASFALQNPNVNIHLYGLLDIMTRFSVPIFFFVSAFGLFYGHNLDQPFHYVSYAKRRARTVLVPYLMWTVLYQLYSHTGETNTTWYQPLTLLHTLFFGLGNYQLYFLVILLWFYSLMPLWRWIVRKIRTRPLFHLVWLYIAQTLFNYWSCYILQANSGCWWLDQLIEYRLSYWVMHYLFIFLLGALFGVFLPSFIKLLKSCHHVVIIGYIATTGAMLFYYYYLLFAENFRPDDAVDVLQQLHPLGIAYTLASTLFFFWLFHIGRQHLAIKPFLALGKHSYIIYLVHPLMMFELEKMIDGLHYPHSPFVVLIFYSATVLSSYVLSLLLSKITNYIPLIGVLTGAARSKPTATTGQSPTLPA